MVFAIGSIGMAQYTLTGYDASAHMSEETHQASRAAAVGMLMSVVVSVIAGFILLVAITFAIPSTRGRSQTQFTYITTYIWQTSMSKNWAEFLLFIVVAPVLLPDRVRHLGLADAVRVLPRPRRSGPSGLAHVSRHRVPVWSVLAVGGARASC